MRNWKTAHARTAPQKIYGRKAAGNFLQKKKRTGAGRASAELENSICPDSTSENLRTQGGREFSAKEKKNRCWKGKCGTGIGGYKIWVTGI